MLAAQSVSALTMVMASSVVWVYLSGIQGVKLSANLLVSVRKTLRATAAGVPGVEVLDGPFNQFAKKNSLEFQTHQRVADRNQI